MKTHYIATLSMLAGIAIGAVAIQTLHAQAKPAVYFVAENDVTDPEAYKTDYLPPAQASIKAHGGRYLAAGTAVAFAGEPPKSRVVIHVWDSMEQLQKWFNSPEYKDARKIGEKYAKFRNYAIPGVFGSLGTAPNMAIHKYLNIKKVPQLFISSVSSRWDDPVHFPWTMMGPRPSFERQGRIYAEYVLRIRPNAKIGVLYQNDEQGKDYLRGLREGLGARAGELLVSEQSYELTDSTVDSQIVTLKASGVDVLLNFSTPKFGAQSIRKVFDMGWKPLHIVGFTASAIKTVLQPAGLEKSVGLISSFATKDPSDAQWRDDPALKDYLAWMKKYYSEGDPDDWGNAAGYGNAQLLVHVLKRCRDDLSRENIMRQAASINNLELPMLLPGIRVNTSPADYMPIKQIQLARFDGIRWVRLGELAGRP